VAPFDRSNTVFVFCSNYDSITLKYATLESIDYNVAITFILNNNNNNNNNLRRLRDIVDHLSENANSTTLFDAPVRGDPVRILENFWIARN